jgi:hypothetical protein
MKYTLSDLEILNEETVDIPIGPDKRELHLYQLYAGKYYDEFIPRFIGFLNYFKSLGIALSLPSGNDWKKKKVVSQATSDVRRAFSHKQVRKSFIKLLQKVGYLDKKLKRKYLEKFIKPDELIRIFLYVYKMNVDGVKKNVDQALVEVFGTTSPLQTSIGTSPSEGGLKEVLKPRFPKLPTLESPS